MTHTTVAGSRLAACCANPANLGVPQLVPGNANPRATVRVCRVCQRRHFHYQAETQHLGMQVGRLGPQED